MARLRESRNRCPHCLGQPAYRTESRERLPYLSMTLRLGKKQFATSTPLIFPARSHAKLKQLANVFVAEAGQKFGGAALFFLPWFQLFISCGISAIGEYSDHMPSSTRIPLTAQNSGQVLTVVRYCRPLMSPIE